MNKEDRKNAVGVAFSGGGLQGISHVGAVKALYELGIKPQFVSGTSSGSAFAAMTAMGCTPDEMYDIVTKNWETLANVGTGLIVKSLGKFLINKNIPRNGIKDGEIIADVIREAMNMKGVTGFENLPINLSVCTVDTLTTDECIFITEDEHLENDHIHYITGAPLELAVRASMSFPAIYTTCPYDKYEFIDGGSKDNLPVKILKDMGVGKVIALGFDTLNYEPQNGLNGLLKVIWRALDVYSIDGTRRSMEMADFTVKIKNENTELFDMGDPMETINEGYNSVMSCRDELLAALNR